MGRTGSDSRPLQILVVERTILAVEEVLDASSSLIDIRCGQAFDVAVVEHAVGGFVGMKGVDSPAEFRGQGHGVVAGGERSDLPPHPAVAPVAIAGGVG